MKAALSRFTAVLFFFSVALFFLDVPAPAAPPADGGPAGDPALLHKLIDRPGAKDAARIRARRSLMAAGAGEEELGVFAQTGTDRVLVILVEFNGTDQFTWTPGVSTWDPIGHADSSEYNGEVGTAAACDNIASEHGLGSATVFNYGPTLHNGIDRPVSAADVSGKMIWMPDFSPAYYRKIIFKKGVVFDFSRQDGSRVRRDMRGRSVNKFFRDMSGKKYGITGDVVGWLPLSHSMEWYGADPCPGSRSGATTDHAGGIPGAGSARSLVTDALDAVNAAFPAFDWAYYDQDKDGLIDRLWIIHAGLGEEETAALLNRESYGESTLWSHSSSLAPAYSVATGVAAGPYIMMPENAGIGVLAHESGHNLGADDLYAYGRGDTSAGFWTIMADDWTGDPIGFQPPAFDPWHLDNWGWLDPYVAISDPSQVYTVKLGQASAFPGGKGVKRAVRIDLPDGQATLPVSPASGSWQWWGGKQALANARLTTSSTVSVPGGGGALTFKAAWDIETGWDFLWVQVSADGGAHWTTLTNGNTACAHDADWIGGSYGFPADLCGAGIGGFTGRNSSWPSPDSQSLDLGAFAGQAVLVRFWYMTDWGTQGEGPFVDDVAVDGFSDGAESDSGSWTYQDPWSRVGGTASFPQSYYLQWRNTRASGGYDSALGTKRWRFGPAAGGLLVWYHNGWYGDNEIEGYLNDFDSFGPKGKMLVVDAHPAPYRDPGWLNFLVDSDEMANVWHRMLMRDAPFSRAATPNFDYGAFRYRGRPGVSLFNDARGYYPGAERPFDAWWATAQWDAGAALPSTGPYGIRAPGMTSSEDLWYNMYYSSGYYGSNFGPLGYDGGTGNPGTTDVQYGWHVQIIEQRAQKAKVRIWNSRQAPKVRLGSPADRAVYAAGAPVPVTWGAPSSATHADLFYSTNGKTWTEIKTGVTGRCYEWTPADPGAATGKLWTRVVVYNGSAKLGAAKNGRPFVVERLRLTAPAGKEKLDAGSAFIVTWEAHGTFSGSDRMVIETSVNDGKKWSLATPEPSTVPAAQGFYQITLPSVPKARKECRIRATIIDGGGGVLARVKSKRFRIVH